MSRISATIYITCSDVTELSTETRRHVGSIYT